MDFWKTYTNTFHLSGKPRDESKVVLIIALIVVAAVLIVGALIFFTWKSYLRKEKQKCASKSQDLLSNPGATFSPETLYQKLVSYEEEPTDIYVTELPEDSE